MKATILLLAAAASLAGQVDFATQVHPILNARCASCHSKTNAQAGLILDSRANVLKAVTPGNSGASALIQRIRGTKAPQMPLGALPLAASEIDLIARWIDEGARAPETSRSTVWQATLALVKPALPPGGDAHPVDRFVLDYFLRKGVTAPKAVSDAQFARRIYLDIWGLLPSPAETAAFVSDASSSKRETLAGRLLGDGVRYADHWISFWNDHLRNDEGVVYHGERKSITPWLKKALEVNMPYRRFVESLLNPTAQDDPDGFLIGVNWRGDVSASQVPVMQAAQNSAQVFLGVNLKCNSCHDSFISKWKLRDAYGLASFFSDKPLEIHRCDAPIGETAQAKFLYPELGRVPADAPLEVKRAEAARLFTMSENGRLPRTVVNRYWRVLFGRGLVEPGDDMDAEPWHPELLDWLAADFVEHGYDLKHLLHRIVTSRAYASAAVKDAPVLPYVFLGPLPRRLSAEQFMDAIAALTGEWRALDPRQPGFAEYVRDWRIKSTPLGRALGRPIRDQVVTERLTQPTTLSSLELANGATLASALQTGARRMLGAPAPPPNLFDSGAINFQRVNVDIDIAGRSKLWLVLRDVDSYDPLRVKAGWANAVLIDAKGKKKPLAKLLKKNETAFKFRDDKTQSKAVLAALPSIVPVDLGRNKFTRLQAQAGADESCLASDINPRIRFFVFGEQPDERRLIPVKGAPPVEPLPVETSADRMIARLYEHALSRPPSGEEAAIARDLLAGGDSTPRANVAAKAAPPGNIAAAGLEDLLWAIALSPEFQYIR